MSKIRDGKKITLHLTIEQFDELEKLAGLAGLSPSNYLRQMMGFPIESQGRRKDLKLKKVPLFKAESMRNNLAGEIASKVSQDVLAQVGAKFKGSEKLRISKDTYKEQYKKDAKK